MYTLFRSLFLMKNLFSSVEGIFIPVNLLSPLGVQMAPWPYDMSLFIVSTETVLSTWPGAIQPPIP